MKHFKILLLSGLAFLGMGAVAQAEDVTCAVPPKCDFLGFEMDIEECEGMKKVHECPANGVYVGKSKCLCSCAADDDCLLHYKCAVTEEGKKRCVSADNCDRGEKQQDVNINDLYSEPDLYDGYNKTYGIAERNNGWIDGKYVENVDLNTAAGYATKYRPDLTGGSTYDYEEGKEDPSPVDSGNWYIPTLGEWMEFYGYNYCNMTDDNLSAGKASSKGVTSTVKESFNMIYIEELDENGNPLSEDTESVDSLDNTYWSSTLDINGSDVKAYLFNPGNGTISEEAVGTAKKSRYFNLLENVFCGENIDIAVGDIIFKENVGGEIGHLKPNAFNTRDKKEYKNPVGVVIWVSESKHSVKIISLFEGENEGVKDLPLLDGEITTKNYSPSDLTDALYQEGKCKNICKMKEIATPFTEDEFYNGKANTEKLKNAVCQDSDDCSTGTSYTSISGNIVKEVVNYAPTGAGNNKFIKKGTWYIPALGEWMDIRGFYQSQFYEDAKSKYYCASSVDCGQGSAGVYPRATNINPIYSILNKTGFYGQIGSVQLWTSTEATDSTAWYFMPYLGQRYTASKKTDTGKKVSFFNFLENVFCDDPNIMGSQVKLGDFVCFSSTEGITYGTDNCVGQKIGVVVWKSPQGQSVKIVQLGTETANWAPETAHNIEELQDYKPSDIESKFGVNSQGYSSCSQVYFYTRWGTLSGQTENNKGCTTSSDVYKEVPSVVSGETLKCYSPSCKCKGGEVFTVNKTCETAYNNCAEFANRTGSVNSLPADLRDVACYPTAEEGTRNLWGSNNTNQVINLSDYPVIARWDGFYEQCFPYWMQEGTSVDGHWQICNYFGYNLIWLDRNDRSKHYPYGCEEMVTVTISGTYKSNGARCNNRYGLRTVKCCKSFRW